ncbi:MAG: glycoside hydrolase family 13 protein [Clostridium sp.]|uniref:glycoside hydrolase family 13 protein n=1 Tax=Clostridium sp. TaxID=1506 RepID=UPI0029083B4A|nr:glycoside hydrolase family 13 protein [Clostridium sp.]MDU7338079.1 glycoside hydrolase family 13 protein [Clostridium sp.]
MFDSRDPVYKNPVGATPSGHNIHFKITLPRTLGCTAATLLMQEDAGESFHWELFWCGMNGEDQEWWECDFTPPRSGLYFYTFLLQTNRGSITIGRSFGGHGDLSGTNQWQLTVYEPGFETPHWLLGGILYQIFPDRFHASGCAKNNIPSGRKMHGEWGEEPQWQPDETGEITNQDFFGGDFKGIREKLPYLQSLGVTCLYLNPIFEAHSNHRYDTADYSRIDPLLGTEEDFTQLCNEAQRYGIRILLDGVFNHTGSDSIYFNREGRYPVQGAYQSKDSPYYDWFEFQAWPDKYDCWWGFLTLPCINECRESYQEYLCGENGIVRKWLRLGASGWRLDVADELSDSLLEQITHAAKAEKPDAVILGEVWEDASNKIAYEQRRRYFQGNQLDSVMNYPYRNATLGFFTGMQAKDAMEILLSIQENYPPQVLRCLMNHLGTHDTERALTILGGEALNGRNREWQSQQCLSTNQREIALRRLRGASLMQYTLPGVPCIYYGDEAGMEGYRDPFNRRCFPWGKEDASLTQWYRTLAKLRQTAHAALEDSPLVPVCASERCLCYIRKGESQQLLVALNSGSAEEEIPLPIGWENATSLVGEAPNNGVLTLPPIGFLALLL